MGEGDQQATPVSRREKVGAWLLKPADAIRTKLRDRSSSKSSRIASASASEPVTATSSSHAPTTTTTTAAAAAPEPSGPVLPPTESSTAASSTPLKPTFVTLQEPNGAGAPDYRSLHQQAFQKFTTQKPEDAASLKECADPKFMVTGWQQRLSDFMFDELKRAKDTRLKIELNDKQSLVLGDLLEKSTGWVKKFVSIGDVVVSYDPTHAALPWAGFRFLLQSAISYQETQKTVWNGTESICKSLAWIYLEEQLFLDGSSQAERLLQDACIEFHIEIFAILAKYVQYYRSRKLTKIAKSPFVTESEYTDSLQRLEKAKAKVRDCSSQVARDTQLQSSRDLQRIIDLIRQLDAPLHRAQQFQDDMYEFMEEDEKRRALDWISKIQYLEHFNTNFKNVLDGSGQWLFEREEFRSWRDSSMSQVLRIHGPPGSGKSTLLSTLIQALRTETGDSQALRPVWFFCLRSEGESERADPVQIIRCLVRQLSTGTGSGKISSKLVERYKQRDQLGLPEQKELTSISKKLIADRGPTFILVDALDECDANTRDVLLDFLTDILEQSPQLVKIFVTSRDDRQESTFLKYPEIRIDAESNEGDIGRYILHELDQKIRRSFILKGDVSPELRQSIIDRLTQAHGGIFRWVALQLQLLRFCNDETEVRESLHTLPHGLFESYHKLYVAEMAQMQNTVPEHHLVALKVFKWLLIANRQLTLLEFCQLVGHTNKKTGKPKQRHLLLQLCFSLVEFDEEVGVFRFCHLSVREFFEHAKFTSENGEFATLELHASAASQCLDVIFQCVKSDLREPEYCLSEWAYHAMNAASARLKEPLRQQLKDLLFDETTYESWLELLKYKSQYSWIGGSGISLFVSTYTRPLMVVCRWGLDEFVMPLAEGLGADQLKEIVYEDSWDRYGLVQRAAANGHEKVLRLLLEQLGMTAEKDRSGNYVLSRTLCPISLAFEGGFFHLSQLLIDHGANVALEDTAARCLTAASEAGRIDQIRLLLDNGADALLGVGPYGSPLVAAVWNGHEDVAVLLLDQGADINGGGRVPDHEEEVSESGRRASGPWSSSDYVHGPPLSAAVERGNDRMMDLLLRRGANVRLMNKESGTALEIAAANGNVRAMRTLLEKGADVNVVGGDLGTALARATRHNRISAMKLLLDKGADVNQHSDRVSAPLIIAAEKGQMEAMRLLLARGADVNHLSKGGFERPQRALAAAVLAGQMEAVKLLLEHDADVNGVDDKSGERPLNQAIRNQDSQAMLLLLDKGADVGGQFKYAYPALHEAVVKGYKEGAQILLAHGAKLDEEDRADGTALSLAVTEGDAEMVRTLLDHGDDANQRGTYYRGCPLSLASSNADVEVMQVLLDNGADVNRVGEKGSTPLHEALHNTWPRKNHVRLLLRHGADPNKVWKGHGPPLQTAIARSMPYGGAEDAIKLLLDRGADPNATFSDGMYSTALQLAVAKERPAMVKLLLAYGADASVVGMTGNALDIARRMDNTWGKEAEELLVSHGAKLTAAGLKTEGRRERRRLREADESDKSDDSDDSDGAKSQDGESKDSPQTDTGKTGDHTEMMGLAAILNQEGELLFAPSEAPQTSAALER